ncbi:uncharacterized protein LOC121386606 [Gigantopelta aegis]|uniref:uncharacterized protein LOC121386606 n=1 Tax=Gigantopelta aegis TaxID=1735272 RepID=UPI001B88B914|nr:uncharacterized protein LOC121386606 [Gigantopelta aegis]
MGEIDLWSGKRSLAPNSQRPKRFWSIVARGAWTAGRALFRSSTLTKISRGAKNRLTKQYFRRGNFRTALRDYKRMNIQGSRRFTERNGVRGYTGRMGNHKVTVRNSSTNGKPTLDIRSKNGKTVRKFRYHN